ncbi:MAG: hypothetical protein GTO14_04275 [Anaerolineales bacterium]|nr:hypothetical protein [Anaerolineales bacterium]
MKNHIRFLGFYLICLLALSLWIVACTRSSVPPESVESAVPTGTSVVSEGGQARPNMFQPSVSYAVAWVASDESLGIREPAGISGSIVSELVYDQRGVELTGAITQLGSSTWVEIHSPLGGTGWVNSWNLTEEKAAGEFCADPRVLTILETLGRSILEQDGQSLLGIVNPNRGLIFRHNWWNPEVAVAPESVSGIFSDLTEIEWGVLSGSDFPIRGSFQQLIIPQLLDVFEHEPQVSCNELLIGLTTREMIWRGEYRNLNFYAFHRPAPTGGNDFDWRTWVVGIEYLGGQPYLTLLIQYRGDI